MDGMGIAAEMTEEIMTLDTILNEAKIKPTVIAGGKAKVYRVGGKPFSPEGSQEIEEEFGIVDLYVSQSPLSSEMNNLVVWAYSATETIFFNKTEQRWAQA